MYTSSLIFYRGLGAVPPKRKESRNSVLRLILKIQEPSVPYFGCPEKFASRFIFGHRYKQPLVEIKR